MGRKAATAVLATTRSRDEAPDTSVIYWRRRLLRIRRLLAATLIMVIFQVVACPAGVLAQEANEVYALSQQTWRLHEQGKYAEALLIAQQALALAERTLGEEHPGTLWNVNELAVLYFHQGRYGEAEPLVKRALAARERVLGKEHPDTLKSLNNLAMLCQTQGRYAEAEPLYRRAIEAFERVLGKEHPDTLKSSTT